MTASLRTALAALASGIVSGGLVVMMATALPLSFRLLLLGLSPLPLFTSGLAAGMLASLAAGLAGAVEVTLVMGSLDAVTYLGAAALPAAILVRQALRATPPKGGAGQPVWYAGGNLLLWLAGLGIAGVLGIVAYTAFFEGGLVAAIHEQFAVDPLAAAMLARIAPGLLVALWTVVVAADGVVAEWLLSLSGFALRPPVDIRRLMLPLWVGPILMVAGLAGAALRQGTVGIVCLNCAIVLVVPFAFLGLAAMHAWAQGRPGGAALVAAAYILLLGSPALLGWPALLYFALALAGLGSVDQVLDFRNMRGLRDGMRRK